MARCTAGAAEIAACGGAMAQRSGTSASLCAGEAPCAVRSAVLPHERGTRPLSRLAQNGTVSRDDAADEAGAVGAGLPEPSDKVRDGSLVGAGIKRDTIRTVGRTATERRPRWMGVMTQSRRGFGGASALFVEHPAERLDGGCGVDGPSLRLQRGACDEERDGLADVDGASASRAVAQPAEPLPPPEPPPAARARAWRGVVSGAETKAGHAQRMLGIYVGRAARAARGAANDAQRFASAAGSRSSQVQVEVSWAAALAAYDASRAAYCASQHALRCAQVETWQRQRQQRAVRRAWRPSSPLTSVAAVTRGAAHVAGCAWRAARAADDAAWGTYWDLCEEQSLVCRFAELRRLHGHGGGAQGAWGRHVAAGLAGATTFAGREAAWSVLEALEVAQQAWSAAMVAQADAADWAYQALAGADAGGWSPGRGEQCAVQVTAGGEGAGRRLLSEVRGGAPLTEAAAMRVLALGLLIGQQRRRRAAAQAAALATAAAASACLGAAVWRADAEGWAIEAMASADAGRWSIGEGKCAVLAVAAAEEGEGRCRRGEEQSATPLTEAEAMAVLALGLLMQRQRHRSAAARAAARAAAAAATGCLVAQEHMAGLPSWDWQWRWGTVRARHRLLYGRGLHIVEQMGHRVGSGLGRREQGRLLPLVPRPRRDREGLMAEGDRMRSGRAGGVPLNRFVRCSVQRAAQRASRAATLAGEVMGALCGRLAARGAVLVSAAAARRAVLVVRAMQGELRRRVTGRVRRVGSAPLCGMSQQQRALLRVKRRCELRGLSRRCRLAAPWRSHGLARCVGGRVPYRWAAPRPKQASSTVENMTKREKAA